MVIETRLKQYESDQPGDEKVQRKVLPGGRKNRTRRRKKRIMMSRRRRKGQAFCTQYVLLDTSFQFFMSDFLIHQMCLFENFIINVFKSMVPMLMILCHGLRTLEASCEVNSILQKLLFEKISKDDTLT
jgi:hypothetical protein